MSRRARWSPEGVCQLGDDELQALVQHLELEPLRSKERSLRPDLYLQYSRSNIESSVDEPLEEAPASEAGA